MEKLRGTPPQQVEEYRLEALSLTRTLLSMLESPHTDSHGVSVAFLDLHARHSNALTRYRYSTIPPHDIPPTPKKKVSLSEMQARLEHFKKGLAREELLAGLDLSKL